MERDAFEPIRGRGDERPRCLACGTLIDAAPEAETFRRRGRFAIVVEWRVCSCGAFARTQRVHVRVRAARRAETVGDDARGA